MAAKPKTVEELFHQLMPEMEPEDIKYLLQRLAHSEGSASTAKNLIIKLKLEFGDQLAQHKAKVEADRKSAAAKAAADMQYKTQLIQQFFQKEISQEHQRRRDQRKGRELEIYMRDHRVTSVDDVPPMLKSIYKSYKSNGCISTPWLTSPKVTKHLS